MKDSFCLADKCLKFLRIIYQTFKLGSFTETIRAIRNSSNRDLHSYMEKIGWSLVATVPFQGASISHGPQTALSFHLCYLPSSFKLLSLQARSVFFKL